jgi:hypothetical protein
MMRRIALLWFLCLPASSQTMDGVTLTFLADFLRATPATVVSAFVCCKPGKQALRVFIA